MTAVQFSHVLKNLDREALIKYAVQHQEGILSAQGVLTVNTGTRTGRSPLDRYIVEDALSKNTVDWGAVNRAMPRAQFLTLWQQAQEHLKNKTVFVSDLQVGAAQEHALSVQVTTEFAWHNLFAQNLFIHPAKNATPAAEHAQWEIYSAPTLQLDPALAGTRTESVVVIALEDKKVLLIGMRYAGEMKKAMFTVLNYFLPEKGILPMHCAANKDAAGRVSLFFGLSGTGKTTLSADPACSLIGDDEHGWSDTGVFNFEGGCYAKCIDLSREKEPIIWDAIRPGSVMENVVLDDHGNPDFSDTRHTQNTRAAYPLDFIAKRVVENQAGLPSSVLFLTCDLYGVLPPIALLDPAQAAYYFLSGYTAKVGSTEIGSTAAVEATFSTCFGAPFFPRNPKVYAELLMRHVTHTGCQVYLINTGWSGGGYSTGGQRFSIPNTRKIVSAATSGALINAATEKLSDFNLTIPKNIPGVPAEILNPENNWSDKALYTQEKRTLIKRFVQNFQQYSVEERIRQAGPQIEEK